MTSIETTIFQGTNGQLVVTIPKKIAEYEGIKSGSKVRWHEVGGHLVGEVIGNGKE